MRKRLLIPAFFAIGALATLAFAVQGDGFKRERSEENRQAKDALEGKEPPELQATAWLNVKGEQPTWKSLKGKVVLIDFWAHW
ncbi:MAG TPA: hypothetical protein VEX38_09890 [Fimbriimonadaceae bacterium]|nr:hypothetical protein [Fimbriimonadaceae bacterium]